VEASWVEGEVISK
jgi:hypothetical protein